MSIKVGLALSTGGARGAAHFGVIKELEDQNIRISAIGGVSIGAAVASLYALRPSTRQLLKLGDEALRRFFSQGFNKVSLNKQFLWELLNFLYGDKDIEDTQIPLVILAYDIFRFKVRAFKEGKIKKAVWAACGVPPFTPPCKIRNFLYMDCALLASSPIKEVLNLGVDLAIVSATRRLPFFLGKDSDRVIYINTVLPSVGWLNFRKAFYCFERGREEAREKICSILEILKR